MNRLVTCESVCIGHPDKLCDLIADSILDECLEKDRNSRVACEVMATGKRIYVAGEITCSKRVNIRWAVRYALKKAGYEPRKFRITVKVHKQSTDIAGGVDHALESRNGDTSWYSTLGAGDQGTVYGYATNENPYGIPMPLYLAHGICRKLDKVREDGVIKDIYPDGKAQVTVEYEGDTPKRVKTIVVSIQHGADKNTEFLRNEIISEVLWPVFKDFPFGDETEILINPSGRFVEGGPAADTGLTGRKIIVDTYGGVASHGGGAFSGKDPTKVDRSGAYMARCVARYIVGSGLAKRCQVSISYAIGKADPVAVEVDTFGTGEVSDEKIKEGVMKYFNFRPAAIIDRFQLRNTIYMNTSTYGHFGDNTNRWDWNVIAEDFRKVVLWDE